VRKVKTDFMNHEVTVNYDGTKTGPEEMVKALNDKGFIVQGTPRVVN
jgi:copper chaperone CopZ